MKSRNTYIVHNFMHNKYWKRPRDWKIFFSYAIVKCVQNVKICNLLLKKNSFLIKCIPDSHCDEGVRIVGREKQKNKKRDVFSVICRANADYYNKSPSLSFNSLSPSLLHFIRLRPT